MEPHEKRDVVLGIVLLALAWWLMAGYSKQEATPPAAIEPAQQTASAPQAAASAPVPAEQPHTARKPSRGDDGKLAGGRGGRAIRDGRQPADEPDPRN